MGCIYRIYNKINGKSYIGQFKKDTPTVRWNRHVRDAKKGSSNAIHKAIIKHGIDAFEVSVLCLCETQEERDKREDELITEYKSMQADNGYNMVRGGKGRAPNFNHKEEHKNKMSVLMTGRKLTPETKEKLSRAKAGKSASEKTKNSIAITSQKKFCDEIFPKRLTEWIIIYNKNGCQPKSNSEDPNEKFAADWRQTIIKKRNNETNKRTRTGLTDEQINILDETPGWTWAAPDSFPEQFENFKLQYEKYEGELSKKGEDENKDRAINWIRMIRQKRRKNDPNLTLEQINILDSCDIWNWKQTTFLTFDEHVKKWIELYKKLKYPPKTSSDIFEERKTANWQHQMRIDYRDKKRRMTQERIDTLNSLEGWVW
jgi:group I intron endonuclease